MSALLRLVRVELTRLRWRRAVVVLLLLTTALGVVILGATAYNTRPISAGDLADAQAQIDSEATFYEADARRCERRPRQYGVDPETTDLGAACRDLVEPRPEDFIYREPLDLEAEQEASGLALAALLSVVMLLIGTTYAGHDWNSGSMSNQLLFEARRLRVWLGKAGAVLAVGLVVSLALSALFWSGLWAFAEARGLDPSGDVVRAVFAGGLRTGALAGFAGLGGYAATMLFRSTVATLGVLLGASIGGAVILGVLSPPGWLRLLPQNNLQALQQDGYVAVDYSVEACPGSGQTAGGYGCPYPISLADSALYFAVVLAVVVVLSMWSFRRRDVP